MTSYSSKTRGKNAEVFGVYQAVYARKKSKVSAQKAEERREVPANLTASHSVLDISPESGIPEGLILPEVDYGRITSALGSSEHQAELDAWVDSGGVPPDEEGSAGFEPEHSGFLP